MPRDARSVVYLVCPSQGHWVPSDVVVFGEFAERLGAELAG
jgi:hypothetical protein